MLASTASLAKVAIAQVKKADRLFFDVETTGLHWSRGDRICGVAVDAGHGTHYLPFRHGEGYNLPEHYLGKLAEAMNGKPVCGHNTKFDAHFMALEGYEIPDSLHCTLLASQLLNENVKSLSLKKLGDQYLGSDSSAEDKQLGEELRKRKLKKGDMWKLPSEVVAPYAIQDVDLTRRLYEYVVPRLKGWGLYEIWLECCRYLTITANMEERGMQVDSKVLSKLASRAEIESAALLDKIRTVAGYDVNPGSPPQMKGLLQTADTKASTVERCNHPAASLLLKWRQWSKMYSSYCKPWAEAAALDGAIHASLNLGGTVAGRPSCSGPNLQAVARKTEVYVVKDAIVARPGRVIVSADYSQAELRLGAHYAKEQRMIDVFMADGDIHQETADEAGIKRNDAKRINFGIVYGLGSKGLAEQLRIPRKEAAGMLSKWHATYPGFSKLADAAENAARTDGLIRMWTGRIRRFDGLVSQYRNALSALVQGGVAEIMRTAIMKLDYHRDIAPMLMQVHDQVLFEPKLDDLEEAVYFIREAMQDFHFTVPMKVDISYGPSWGDQKEIVV